MLNPFGSQPDSGSYDNLRKRRFQCIQPANINGQILDVIKKALETENVVLSLPERKRLFSEIVKLVSEHLTKKLDEDRLSV